MRSMREGFELIFMAILAGFAADVISGIVRRCCFSLDRFDRLRSTA